MFVDDNAFNRRGCVSPQDGLRDGLIRRNCMSRFPSIGEGQFSQIGIAIMSSTGFLSGFASKAQRYGFPSGSGAASF
jgi:hypothetical protein